MQPTAQYITYSRNNLVQGYSSLTILDILFTKYFTTEKTMVIDAEYVFVSLHIHLQMSQVMIHQLLR